MGHVEGPPKLRWLSLGLKNVRPFLCFGLSAANLYYYWTRQPRHTTHTILTDQKFSPLLVHTVIQYYCTIRYILL